MIAYVSGTLTEKSPTSVVIEAGGVGYRLLIPTSSFDHLPAVGEKAKLLSVLVVREDSQTLFGFAAESERSLFETLTGVSGIGPKLALAALSAMRPDELRDAVMADDPALLTRIPGVGKKTAERMVVELRDKVVELDGVPAKQATGVADATMEARSDARAGLVALGLSRAEAEKRLRKVLRSNDGMLSAEELIRLALRKG